ncbi:hypothetical protein MBLNU13_g05352t2 [Cladosporium sp. NU13]
MFHCVGGVMSWGQRWFRSMNWAQFWISGLVDGSGVDDSDIDLREAHDDDHDHDHDHGMRPEKRQRINDEPSYPSPSRVNPGPIEPTDDDERSHELAQEHAAVVEALATCTVDFSQAPFDMAEDELEWLHAQDYSDEDLAKGNGMFEPGSSFAIKIDSLIKWRSKGEQLAQKLQEGHIDPQRLHGATGCRPSHMIPGVQKGIVPLTQPIGKQKKYQISPQKVVAIFKSPSIGGLPDSEMWKAVAPLNKSNPNGTMLYECGGRCNIWGDKEHCCTDDHCNMETARHNDIRASHHSGKHGCFEDEGLHCLGPEVTRNKWKADDKREYLCQRANRKTGLVCLQKLNRHGGCPACGYRMPVNNKMSLWPRCKASDCDVRTLDETGLCFRHRPPTHSKRIRKEPGCVVRTVDEGGYCSVHSDSQGSSALLQTSAMLDWRPRDSRPCQHFGCFAQTQNEAGYCDVHQNPDDPSARPKKSTKSLRQTSPGIQAVHGCRPQTPTGI